MGQGLHRGRQVGHPAHPALQVGIGEVEQQAVETRASHMEEGAIAADARIHRDAPRTFEQQANGSIAGSWNAEFAGHDVGGPTGNDAHHLAGAAGNIGDLTDRAVTTDRHEHVGPGGMLASQVLGVAGTLGDEDFDPGPPW